MAEGKTSGSGFQPYIPASQSLPEITVKALILGVLLSAVLAGANAYLGLKVGLTVSASIPAAVISMAILRAFRTHNILENNIVQTAASAGESLAAGVIFTLPALILLGFWNGFPFLPTMGIAMCGGVLGVLFTVPLRRALIIEADLRFPEGLATAEVLKAGATGGAGARLVAAGGIAAALLKLAQSGFKVASGSVHGSLSAGRSVFGMGSDLFTCPPRSGVRSGAARGVPDPGGGRSLLVDRHPSVHVHGRHRDSGGRGGRRYGL